MAKHAGEAVSKGSGDRMRPDCWTLVMVAVSLTAAACGSSRPSEGGEQARSGVPVTHDEQSSEEALFTGTLVGTVDCLGLKNAESVHALVLPKGSVADVDNGVVVLSAGVDEIARTGEDVSVGGGARPNVEACAGVNATGPTIVVGAIERSHG